MEDLEKSTNQSSFLDDSEKESNESRFEDISEMQGIDDSYEVQKESPKNEEVVEESQTALAESHAEAAPLCFNCGNITQRSGSCYVCTACGSTSGCS